MLLSETSYNDIVKNIAEFLASGSTKFSTRDEQNNVITVLRKGPTITAYVNDTLACKGEASDDYAKDANDIYWWVRRVLTNTEVADPLDSIANSVHAEEAENRSVNRNYPAYMR